MPDQSPAIRVKFITKAPRFDARRWSRQLPSGADRWGNCRFIFDPAERHYDWLVVYDELPPEGEILACPREHTLLITVEPSSIKVYGNAYLKQFGHVLTSQEPWALAHPSVIRRMPALQWFYGRPMGEDTLDRAVSYDQIRANDNAHKPGQVSTVCSSKAMGHTLHRLRYDFTQALKAQMPELEVFGRGVRPINDKAEALDDYRYHLSIENHLAPHHMTEKLVDVYLAGALPLYFGAPNVSDYFPEESYIPVDIREAQGAIEAIQKAVADNEYDKRLPAIREAKRLVLERYNLFAVVARAIEQRDTGRRGDEGARLINRRAMRNRNPIGALGYLLERYRVQQRVRREQRV